MAIATIIHLLVNMEILQFEGDSHRPFTQITVLLVNFIIMLSFPLNFAIYCGMSAQFRNTFKALFVGRFFSQRLNGSQSAVPPDTNTVSLAIVGDGGSTARKMSTLGGKSNRSIKQNGSANPT